MKITAAVVEELDGPVTLQTLELDEPSPGEVLVRLAATGICHTDGLARTATCRSRCPASSATRAPARWLRAAAAGRLADRQPLLRPVVVRDALADDRRLAREGAARPAARPDGPAGLRHLDGRWGHISTLWGKRIVGILGGSGRSRELMTTIMQLYAQGRFPFDRLVQYFELADVQEALDKSYAGEVIKPILRMPA